MPIYWTLKSIPELAPLPPSERRRVWRTACWRAHRDWRVWAAMLVAGACGGLGFVAGHVLDWPIVGSLVGAAVGGFLQSQIVVDLARPYVSVLAILAGKNGNPLI